MGLVEALLLWLVLEDLPTLLAVFAVTLGALLVGNSATNLRHYRELRAQQYTLVAFLVNLLLFGAVVVIIGKRAEGELIRPWLEFLVLLAMASVCFGVRAFVEEVSS